jgi:hypothetical protein
MTTLKVPGATEVPDESSLPKIIVVSCAVTRYAPIAIRAGRGPVRRNGATDFDQVRAALHRDELGDASSLSRQDT